MAENTLELAQYQNDHDLLVVLHTEMRALRDDIKRMSDSITLQVTDHENRIRTIESAVTTVSANKVYSDNLTRVGGGIFIVLVGAAEFIINRLWH